jgi:hypothetical protein
MRPFPGTPVRVSEVLPAALPGLAEHLRAATIQRQWADIAGAAANRHSRPEALRQGVLAVVVDNSVWLQELTLRSQEILGGLEARHGRAVSAVRFTLGRLPARAAPAPARPAPLAPRLGPAALREIDQLVAGVTDPGVSASLRRLVTKDWLTRARPTDEARSAERHNR